MRLAKARRSVTVYVTLRIFGPTLYVRIFDRRSVTYGAFRRRRDWRGALAAQRWPGARAPSAQECASSKGRLSIACNK